MNYKTLIAARHYGIWAVEPDMALEYKGVPENAPFQLAPRAELLGGC